MFCTYLNSGESTSKLLLMCSNSPPSLALNHQPFLIQEQAVQIIMSCIFKREKKTNKSLNSIFKVTSGVRSQICRESEGHVFLWCLLVGEIKEEDAGQGADQEDDVKPTVVEVELQLSQNLRHNGAILQRHAHAHQQYG